MYAPGRFLRDITGCYEPISADCES